MKKQKNTSESGEGSNPVLSEQEKVRQFVELIYGNTIPQTISWLARMEEAAKRTGFRPSDDQLSAASAEYFKSNSKYETYWSMVVMKHNVCNSLREREGEEEGAANENTSYKAKLENAMKLAAIELEIERRELDLFKGNADVKEQLARNVGKQKSKYEGASLHDQLIGGKIYE
jgi:hypothetical protein